MQPSPAALPWILPEQMFVSVIYVYHRVGVGVILEWIILRGVCSNVRVYAFYHHTWFIPPMTTLTIASLEKQHHIVVNWSFLVWSKKQTLSRNSPLCNIELACEINRGERKRNTASIWLSLQCVGSCWLHPFTNLCPSVSHMPPSHYAGLRDATEATK